MPNQDVDGLREPEIRWEKGGYPALRIRAVVPMRRRHIAAIAVGGTLASIMVIGVFATPSLPHVGGRGGGLLCLFLAFGLLWPLWLLDPTTSAWELTLEDTSLRLRGRDGTEQRQPLQALDRIEHSPPTLGFTDGTEWVLDGPSDALASPLRALARLHRELRRPS